MSASCVGRLAPSPTGLLHLGHARSFLVAYWQVRAQAGRLVLRLEDLDTPRVAPDAMATTLRDLEWLGLDWDAGPRLQSGGLDRIRAAARELESRGLAYACTCTRGELRSVASAPHAGDREPRYPGTCRARYASIAHAESSAGRSAGLRFRVPAGRVTVHDTLAGACTFDVQSEVGDFLILRRDKTPAYQLAVVVDDAADGVTDVVRGDDLLPSAARQFHLQHALGFAHPRWLHLPLVCDESGRRLAKRSDDLSLAELRASGTDPRAIVRWAAESIGIPVQGRVEAAEVSPHFDVSRIPRAPVLLSQQTLAELRHAGA